MILPKKGYNYIKHLLSSAYSYVAIAHAAVREPHDNLAWGHGGGVRLQLLAIASYHKLCYV